MVSKIAFLVIAGDFYEPYYIIGVFDTREKAEKKVNEIKNKSISYDFVEIKEYKIE